eukprot:7104492-Pyramimonas_sp.AAC.1
MLLHSSEVLEGRPTAKQCKRHLESDTNPKPCKIKALEHPPAAPPSAEPIDDDIVGGEGVGDEFATTKATLGSATENQPGEASDKPAAGKAELEEPPAPATPPGADVHDKHGKSDNGDSDKDSTSSSEQSSSSSSSSSASAGASDEGDGDAAPEVPDNVYGVPVRIETRSDSTAIGLRVDCPNASHVGCNKYRSLKVWNDELGEHAAILYLGTWLSEAYSRSHASHAAWRPTLTQVKQFQRSKKDHGGAGASSSK